MTPCNNFAQDILEILPPLEPTTPGSESSAPLDDPDEVADPPQSPPQPDVNSDSSPPESDLLVENAELREKVHFLTNTVDGLEAEVKELRKTIFDNKVVFDGVLKSFASMEKAANKESREFQALVQKQKEQIQILQEASNIQFY